MSSGSHLVTQYSRAWKESDTCSGKGINFHNWMVGNDRALLDLGSETGGEVSAPGAGGVEKLLDHFVSVWLALFIKRVESLFRRAGWVKANTGGGLVVRRECLVGC